MESFATLAPSILLVVKAAVLIFLALYIIFAIAVVRQVKLMAETIEVGFETHIKFIAYAHLVFSVFVFVISTFIL